MRSVAIIACLFSAGCARHVPSDPVHDEPRAPFAKEWWCTLRIEPSRIFVDGDPTSPADAVTYCKRTTGAFVVEHDGGELWNSTRLALEREGVRICVRGRTCDLPPWRDACRPIQTGVRRVSQPIDKRPPLTEKKPPKVMPLVAPQPVTTTTPPAATPPVPAP